MNILFGTVVYESAYQYLFDFINSINNQIFKGFKLLIINDDIEQSKLSAALKLLSTTFEVIKYEEKFTAVELRIKLLLEAKARNSDLLIIGDADDMFSPNRVGKVVAAAKTNDNYDIFYNRLETFDNAEVFQNLPTVADSIECIADHNFLGLTNTAIRMSAIPVYEINTFGECLQPIFDWYLFSRLLISNHKGFLVDDAVTYYRYHNNNLVGNQNNDSKMIDKEVKVKTIHYKSLMYRSDIMKNKYISYKSGRYELTSTNSHHFWWGYTIGG